MNANGHAALVKIVENAPQMLAMLRVVRDLRLGDWAIGAGVIRALVWDSLLGRAATPVADVDVLYHDESDLSWAAEEAAEIRLAGSMPHVPWSVRNQARMHMRQGDEPYGSTENAMRYWLETPTCVAVHLTKDGQLKILAPYGLHDLFNLRIRPTPRGRERRDAYRARLSEKCWQERWPGVTVEL